MRPAENEGGLEIPYEPYAYSSVGLEPSSLRSRRCTIESGICVPSAAGTFTSSATIPEKSTGDGGSSFVSASAFVFGSYAYHNGAVVQDVSWATKPGRSYSAARPETEPFTGSGISLIAPS